MTFHILVFRLSSNNKTLLKIYMWLQLLHLAYLNELYSILATLSGPPYNDAHLTSLDCDRSTVRHLDIKKSHKVVT